MSPRYLAFLFLYDSNLRPSCCRNTRSCRNQFCSITRRVKLALKEASNRLKLLLALWLDERSSRRRRRKIPIGIASRERPKDSDTMQIGAFSAATRLPHHLRKLRLSFQRFWHRISFHRLRTVSTDDRQLASSKLGVIIIEAREQVTVHVEDHLDRGMPEQSLHPLRREAALDRP